MEMVGWWTNHQIIKCRGCDTISFRIISGSSEDINPYTGEYEVREFLYPNREKERIAIMGHEEFPVKTRHIYLETLNALNTTSPILTAIGLRAIIESVCIDKCVLGASLKGKIDQLVSQGYLARTQADFLHTQRFMGNEAAHEIKQPKPGQLIPAIDIIETLLKAIYILPKLNSELRT